MFNELLDRLTGHDRYRPFHPRFSEQGWRHGLVWSSARDRWVATCRTVASAGRVEELHSVRDNYLRVLQAYALFLKGMLLLVPDDHEDRPDPDRLEKAFAELSALHAELSAKWVTLDDLYALVAEQLSPTADREPQLAARSAPPQAWYDEDADPFAPAD